MKTGARKEGRVKPAHRQARRRLAELGRHQTAYVKRATSCRAQAPSTPVRNVTTARSRRRDALAMATTETEALAVRFARTIPMLAQVARLSRVASAFLALPSPWHFTIQIEPSGTATAR